MKILAKFNRRLVKPMGQPNRTNWFVELADIRYYLTNSTKFFDKNTTFYHNKRRLIKGLPVVYLSNSPHSFRTNNFKWVIGGLTYALFNQNNLIILINSLGFIRLTLNFSSYSLGDIINFSLFKSASVISNITVSYNNVSSSTHAEITSLASSYLSRAKRDKKSIVLPSTSIITNTPVNYTVGCSLKMYLSCRKSLMVRGVAKNPVDHPNGGRSKTKGSLKNPWGGPAKYNK